MSVTFQWDNSEHTAIYCTFTDPWTWEEFDRMVHETDTLFDEAEHTVDLIFDFSAGRHMPNDAINHIRKLSRKSTSNLGVIIMTNQPRIMQLIGDIIGRLYPEALRRIRLAPDPDEARKILAQIQATRVQKA